MRLERYNAASLRFEQFEVPAGSSILMDVIIVDRNGVSRPELDVRIPAELVALLADERETGTAAA